MATHDKPKPRFPRRDAAPRHDVDEDAAPRHDAPEPPEHHDKLAKIAGIQAVSALFRRDPHQIVRLYYNEKMKKIAGSLCAQMARMQRPYRLVEDSELQKISGTVLHGGVVVAAVPRVVADLDMDEARACARAGEPVLILDGVGNPHNLGAIARTMAFFGVKHLLLTDHPNQAGLSDAAHRVAEGGLEFMDVHRLVGLPKACRQLREFYRVIGTSLNPKARELGELPPDPRPTALVMGNEESGLSAETLAVCDAAVIIHGAGQVQSLNVSATAAVLIHQITAKAPPAAPANRRPTSGADRGRPTPRPRRAGPGGPSRF
ncbi:MAG: TrmH family RNA methyltransferase [Candidatus Methylumidiphilus sp.]